MACSVDACQNLTIPSEQELSRDIYRMCGSCGFFECISHIDNTNWTQQQCELCNNWICTNVLQEPNHDGIIECEYGCGTFMCIDCEGECPQCDVEFCSTGCGSAAGPHYCFDGYVDVKYELHPYNYE